MKAFYDQNVPQVAKDVLKKIGGGIVENVVIDNHRPEDESWYNELED